MHFLHEYWSVVSDPAHLLAEGTWEIGTFLLVAYPAKFFIKRHDRKHHGKEN